MTVDPPQRLKTNLFSGTEPPAGRVLQTPPSGPEEGVLLACGYGEDASRVKPDPATTAGALADGHATV